MNLVAPDIGGRSAPVQARLAASALSRSHRRPSGAPAAAAGRAAHGAHTEPDVSVRWLARSAGRLPMAVDRVALDDLGGWTRDATTGNLGHRSGGFFSVEGMAVEAADGPVGSWSQPVIHQPEVGILGILAKEFDGVLRFLLQAKAEPGNHNGVQLSPTVQATRSNYTRVHRGRPVPYLDYFRHASRHRVLVDVRQSEQGSWFFRKRNRNMVVEVAEEVEVRDGFRWLTLGEIHALLARDDTVNMDTRTVLGCLPVTGTDLTPMFDVPGSDRFRTALVRSCDPAAGALHDATGVLSWITEARTVTGIRTRLVPLDEVKGWRRTAGRIHHRSGRFFEVIGVRVQAAGREVERWDQPMIRPVGTGVIAFLAGSIGGVLHVLARASAQPGYADVIELAPTVQCTPGNHEHLPAAARPRFLEEVLGADEERIRFDAVLSEEGGRFFHARNRYVIVEVDPDAVAEPPGFRWLAPHQLGELVRHGHYLNIEARSLLACLHSLKSTAGSVK
ncbi:NDP-hexose 2,3-dehydratase family protein [Actinoallomurus sp. NBC_01490]|uniref:NDP-hexose 2,3-dehydratase family protein n=1 Tax=Actinoallomurus sp. NBC_01490 TaxID=2903557 RepID=UPI002E2F48B2|nr:NDP-hexose 2,3-dehydratase family protein [Actinoallomurus sp. NBC_01490]